MGIVLSAFRMLRDTQEKAQFVRKLEEIVPVLKNYDKIQWIVNVCDADPLFSVFSSEYGNWDFRPFEVNLKTGWHSEVVYKDSKGVHRIPEGVTEISDDWSDMCYRGGCVCRDGSYTVRLKR